MFRFAANQIETQFVAPNVQRDIFVLDDSTLDRGYVVARTRTFDITCTPVNEQDRPDFGDPEIVHIQSAWNYKPNCISTIPVVTPRELQDWVQVYFPDATFAQETMDEELGSWRLRVSGDQNVVEYVWGPLSGFGGIDVTNPVSSVDRGCCDIYFHSIVDAALYALEKLDASTRKSD